MRVGGVHAAEVILLRLGAHVVDARQNRTERQALDHVLGRLGGPGNLDQKKGRQFRRVGRVFQDRVWPEGDDASADYVRDLAAGDNPTGQ